LFKLKILFRIKIKFLSLKKYFYLKLNRFRLSFRIRKIEGRLRIYVHEKNKRKIKNVKWIFSISGLIFSLIILPPLYSFLIALFLFLSSLSIEKFFFFFVSFYVHYLPDFEINNDLWLGMMFGYGEPPDRKFQIPIVGLLFSDEGYAKKFFSLLRIWNYGLLEDKDNNFVISIILDTDDSYLTYIYPNISRQTAKEFFSYVESKRKKTFPEELHVRLFAFLFTMKRFIITEKSYFPTFMRRYNDGVPYRLEAFIGTEENWKIAEKIPGFTKFNLKIKKRTDLNREDIEYDLLRIFGD